LESSVFTILMNFFSPSSHMLIMYFNHLQPSIIPSFCPPTRSPPKWPLSYIPVYFSSFFRATFHI
jgi:hypothetical protein